LCLSEEERERERERDHRYTKYIEEAIDIYAKRLAINSCFVELVLPSRGIILANHFTLYGLCQIKPRMRQKYQLKTYSFLYFIYVSLWKGLFAGKLPFVCLILREGNVSLSTFQSVKLCCQQTYKLLKSASCHLEVKNSSFEITNLGFLRWHKYN